MSLSADQFQTLLNTLPTLKHDQLSKMAAAINHLIEKPQLARNRSDILYDAIHRALVDVSIQVSPRPVSTAWKAQAALALAFVEKTTPGLSRIEFRLLMNIYAGALIDYTISVCGLSPRAATRMTGRLADAVGRAFPGYAEAGLLLKLVRKAESLPVGASKPVVATPQA